MKANKKHIMMGSSGLAVLFALLVIIPTGFPFLGLSLWFLAFVTFTYSLKENKDAATTAFFCIALVLAAFIAIRAQGVMVFLNIVGVLYFGTLMALHGQERKATGLFESMTAPFRIGLQSFLTKNTFAVGLKSLLSLKKRESGGKHKEALIGSAIGVILLWIVIPLLASANPLFSDWMKNALDVVNLSWLSAEHVVVNIFRIIVALILAFFIPRFLSRTTKPSAKIDNFIEIKQSISLAIPKIALLVVFVIFFVSQMQLYLASPETLATLGYTNSEVTREVFGQLSVITLLVLGLVYYDKNKSRASRITTYLLIASAFLLSFVALKSVLDYISTWGYTEKRLYGFATVLWVYGVYLLYLYHFARRHVRTLFTRHAFTWTGVVLVVLNFTNIDYMIFHNNRAHDPHGVDHMYLTGLSSDTRASGDHLIYLYETLKAEDSGAIEGLFYVDDFSARQALWKVERLQNKYSHLDVRAFNFNEYRDFLAVKDIDVEEIRNYSHSQGRKVHVTPF